MKAKDNRFEGMLRHPYTDANKNSLKPKEPKKRKKARNGSATSHKGLSPYQLRTQKQFMLVRPGETEAEWNFRTRFRRVRSEEELAMTANGKKRLEKVRVESFKRKKNAIRIRISEKNFNFLKFYVFIINWASTKYNIAQLDIEIGFHFYGDPHFTRDQFANKVLMISGQSGNIFNRFKKSGYIIEMLSVANIEQKKKPTGFYRFSIKFTNMLSLIYDKIAFQKHFDFKPILGKTIPPEVEKMIMEMATENDDIIKGLKEPENFNTLNQQNHE